MTKELSFNEIRAVSSALVSLRMEQVDKIEEEFNVDFGRINDALYAMAKPLEKVAHYRVGKDLDAL